MIVAGAAYHAFEAETVAAGPFRSGEPWTKAEDTELIAIIEKADGHPMGRTLCDAAIRLGRTFFGVQTHVRELSDWEDLRMHGRTPARSLGPVCDSCRIELPSSKVCGWCA